MSYSDYTRNILNIKGQNIYFDEIYLKEVKINNNIVKFFHGTLTYTPTVWPGSEL